MTLWLTLVTILITALISRLLVFAYIGGNDPRQFYTYDSDGYVIRATNLLHYGVFSDSDMLPLTPDLQRTPVYPLVLAVVFGLSGREATVIVCQTLMGSLTVLFVFLLARELQFSALAGLIAACLVAVEPISILMTNQLLTETLFVMELTVGLWLLARYWYERKIHCLIISAVVLALAALTRPIAQALPLALLPLFAVTVKQGRLRAIATAGLLFVLISGSLVSAWAYRNYRVGGVFTLSTIANTNLLYYRARAVLAEAKNIGTGAAMDAIRAQVNEAVAQQDLTQAERMAFQQQLAYEIFRQYPGLTVTMMAKGAVRLLVDPGYTLTCTLLDLDSTAFECFPGQGTMLESNMLDRVIGKFRDMTIVQQFTLLWSMFLLGVMYLGAIIGVLRLARDQSWTTGAIFVTVIIYFVVLSVGGETTFRFRVPTIPFLAILAGGGYEMLLNKYKHRCSAARR